MQPDSKTQFEQEIKNDVQKKVQISPTLPVNGCLWVIILSALACMAVKSCKMVNMKHDEAKVKHEIVMDGLNKVKATRANVIQYKGR